MRYVLSHPEIKWDLIRNTDMADFSRSPGQGFISLQWESAGAEHCHQEADVAKTVSGHSWTRVTCSVLASHNHYPGDCQQSQDDGVTRIVMT